MNFPRNPDFSDFPGKSPKKRPAPKFGVNSGGRGAYGRFPVVPRNPAGPAADPAVPSFHFEEFRNSFFGFISPGKSSENPGIILGKSPENAWKISGKP